LDFGDDGGLIGGVRRVRITFVFGLATTFVVVVFFTGGLRFTALAIAPCYYRLLFSEPIIKR
jgi:hypothetical protein